MQTLDQNKKLVMQVGDLHAQNTKLSATLTKLKPQRRDRLCEQRKGLNLVKHKVQTENQNTQVDSELAFRYTNEAAIEVDTSDLKQYVMANGTNESFRSVGCQTGPEVQIICSKCNGKGGGTFFNQVSGSRTPKKSKRTGASTPRSAKSPKGRTILEGKVLLMIYDILEKRCISDSTGKSKVRRSELRSKSHTFFVSNATLVAGPGQAYDAGIPPGPLLAQVWRGKTRDAAAGELY